MFCNNKCFRYYSLMICKEKGDWGSERSERVMRWKDLEDYRVVCKFEDNLLKKKVKREFGFGEWLMIEELIY